MANAVNHREMPGPQHDFPEAKDISSFVNIH